MTVIDRFWSKVDKSGECWIWMAARTKSGGYGVFAVAGSRDLRRAHRFAWELESGPIPDGLFVCHKCDVPACVRPDHLFLGTHTDNMRDMFRKGRRPNPCGERHPSARLTADRVYQIRERARAGESLDVLAEVFGVTSQHIGQIVLRKKWRHLSEQPGVTITIEAHP